jgi:hypothetical protein
MMTLLIRRCFNEHLFRTTLSQTRAINRVPPNSIVPTMVLRICRIPRLGCSNTTLGIVSRLEWLPSCWVGASAFRLGDGAVVRGATAIFDG